MQEFCERHIGSPIIDEELNIRVPLQRFQADVEAFLKRCEQEEPEKSCVEELNVLFSTLSDLQLCHEYEFQSHLAACQEASDKTLQLLILWDFLPQRLPASLYVSCEDTWNIPRGCRIQEHVLLQPTLAVSFNFDAFCGTDRFSPYPLDLRTSMCPGSKGFFPFLILGATHNLSEALNASLDAANQALFNICAWMIIVRPETDFLQNVRTFSVVANTDEIVARIHCVTAIESSEHLGDSPGMILHYSFRGCSIKNYKANDGVTVVNAVIKYAENILYKILQDIYRDVCRREEFLNEQLEKHLLQR